MFGWAIAFLILALVAALFGFGGLPEDPMAVGVARILFAVFAIAFLLALLAPVPAPPPAAPATAATPTPDPWSGVGRQSWVREYQTASGVRCVIAQTGYTQGVAISCDWPKP